VASYLAKHRYTFIIIFTFISVCEFISSFMDVVQRHESFEDICLLKVALSSLWSFC